ncbi:MAG TPA: cytochrome P450 [Novosphingobium sp.]|nr:cytochrome P450 [Novosphingobium sp.]
MTEMSDLSPVPDHVPAEAVHDFDMRADPGLLADPHARIAELLREAGPLFWTPRNGGRWIALGYPEVFEIARDFERFTSTFMPKAQMEAMLAMMPRDMPRIPRVTPISIDPPEHGLYRAPLQKAFSPRAAMARQAEVRALCDELIDRVIDQGHCDFIPAIAEPLPVTVFLRLMGLPVERLGEFRDLVHEFLASSASANPMVSAMMMRKVADAMLPDLLARRDAPRDDLISELWSIEVDGQPMSLDLMEDYAVLLFVAGLDTVINGMGFAVRHLALNPALQDELRADPSRIPQAVEEILRRYSFALPMRRVAKDTELAGRRLKENDWIVLHYAGAGLDGRQFPDPEKVDIDRADNVHIAFGAGPHRCLGAHLARVELQVLYQQMLARLPTWRLDPDHPPRFHSGNIIAVDSLPIRWD